jgi:hypothetical protein
MVGKSPLRKLFKDIDKNKYKTTESSPSAEAFKEALAISLVWLVVS